MISELEKPQEALLFSPSVFHPVSPLKDLALTQDSSDLDGKTKVNGICSSLIKVEHYRGWAPSSSYSHNETRKRLHS